MSNLLPLVAKCHCITILAGISAYFRKRMDTDVHRGDFTHNCQTWAGRRGRPWGSPPAAWDTLLRWSVWGQKKEKKQAVSEFFKSSIKHSLICNRELQIKGNFSFSLLVWKTTRTFETSFSDKNERMVSSDAYTRKCGVSLSQYWSDNTTT